MKLCQYCGEPIENPHTNQKYHIPCSYEIANNKRGERKKQDRSEAKAAKKRSGPSRDMVAKRANKEGLTYGQYSVKYRLYPWLQEAQEIKPPERRILTFNEVMAMAATAGMSYEDYAKSIGL